MPYEPGFTLSSSPAIRAILPASTIGGSFGAILFSISILLAPTVGMYDPVLGPPTELAMNVFIISLVVGTMLTYLFILLVGAPLAKMLGDRMLRWEGAVIALITALAIAASLYLLLSRNAPTNEPTWQIFTVLCGFAVPSALLYVKYLRKGSED